MMDHEKPQAVYPQIFEYDGATTATRSTFTPDPVPLDAISIAGVTDIDDQPERRGESVW